MYQTSCETLGDNHDTGLNLSESSKSIHVYLWCERSVTFLELYGKHSIKYKKKEIMLYRENQGT